MDEIEKAKLVPGELEELETSLRKMENCGKIKEGLARILQFVKEDDNLSAVGDVITDDSKKASSEIIQKASNDSVKPIYIFFAFFSCMMNALSGLLDKILMQDMNSSQLQFWYMLFMVSYYAIYMLVTRTKLSRDVWKNGWI